MLPLYLGIVLAVGARIQAHKQVECFEVFGRNTCPDGYQCREGQCEPDFGEPLWCSWMTPCGPNHECIEGSCVPGQREPTSDRWSDLAISMDSNYMSNNPECQTNSECKLNERCTFGKCEPDESSVEPLEIITCFFFDRVVVNTAFS